MSGGASLERFDALWANLFRTHMHLDSALAKEAPSERAAIAPIVQAILRRPIALAHALGVEIAAGAPWSLPSDALAVWTPAHQMAERLLSGARMGDLAGDVIAEFPPVLVEMLVGENGEPRARSILRALAAAPPRSLRAVRSIGAEGLMRALVDDGTVDAQRIARSSIAPLGVVLQIDGAVHTDSPASAATITRHPLLASGAFEIQDEGAQVMAHFAIVPNVFSALLSGEPGPIEAQAAPMLPRPNRHAALTVVDACAGAGGKTLAIADTLENTGRIFAYDVSKRKLDALRTRAKRAGLRNVKTVLVEEGRESQIAAKFEASADVVLVDAPCSGLGVLRRNPDAKWRIDASAFPRLEAIETRLLDVYARLVRRGGRLVYGVCTLRKSETTAIVEAFLAHRSDFARGPGGFLGPGPCDGFFMQAFERIR
jgi:16S rRNA C967 or C1407 C5-methylase (RsmB/RsmF family)